MFLFLSMVVWQPFCGCWRLIIARVSETHVAYHIKIQLVVYLHHWNKVPPFSQMLMFLVSSPSHLYNSPLDDIVPVEGVVCSRYGLLECLVGEGYS